MLFFRINSPLKALWFIQVCEFYTVGELMKTLTQLLRVRATAATQALHMSLTVSSVMWAGEKQEEVTPLS